MIMYGYKGGNDAAGLYEFSGAAFHYKTLVKLSDLRPEIATLLRVKARIACGTVSVYLDDEGNVIDTPEILQ